MLNNAIALSLVLTCASLSLSGAEKRLPAPVAKGLPYSAILDTNLVFGIWSREYSGDAAKLQKEGVEELLTVIASIHEGRRAKLFFSEPGIAFYFGRAFVALSKLDITNQLDLTAYRQFLLLNFAPSKGGSILGIAADRHSDLSVLGKSTHSYMAKRLYLLSKIGYVLEQRYTTDAHGKRQRMVEPLLDHPSNRNLFTAATNAATLFLQTKKQFRDVTLESAIKLALASLERDGKFIALDLAAEFQPLQVLVDALNAALTFPNAERFDFWSWLALPIDLKVRGIETLDCFFSDKTEPEILKQGIEFLRADLERCRTMKALEPHKTPDYRKMSEEEFMKFLKSGPYEDPDYAPLAPATSK